MVSEHPLSALFTAASRIARQALSDAHDMALACRRVRLRAEADIQHLITTLPPPGTRDRDLLVAMLSFRGQGWELHQAAIGRLADQTPWKPSQPAYAALRHRASEEARGYSSVRRDVLMTALVLVLAERTERTEPLRLGQRGSDWVRDEAGKRLAVTGADMAMFGRNAFWHWLTLRVCREAESIALDRGSCTRHDALDRRAVDVPPEVDAGNPLDLLVDKERAEEDRARLCRILEHATPQQRQLLGLIAGGATQGEAARQLGLKPSTARVQMKRLRERTGTV